MRVIRPSSIVWIGRQRLFSIDSAAAIPPPLTLPGVTITPVTPQCVDKVVDFRGREHAVASGRLLEGGQLGVYAWADGRVVGHAWSVVCRDRQCRANGYMSLVPGEAFIHYCHVAQDHRGRGIYTAMLIALSRRLFEESDVKRVLIDSHKDNLPSLEGIVKAGFHGIGAGVYIRILGVLLAEHVTFGAGLCR